MPELSKAERGQPLSRKGANVRYVIIGNSAAGHAAAASIRRYDPSGKVLILSDEPYASYYRPLIPFFIDNRVAFSGLFREPETVPQGVEIRLGVRVESISPEKKLLFTNDGETLPYDRLLIATGGSPARLSVPGMEGPEAYVFRSMADAVGLRKAAGEGRRAVIIGGGRVGTKAAMALSRRGVQLTVVEQGDRIVPFQFDQAAAVILTRALESQGIRVLLNQSVSHLERRKDTLEGVVLNNGSTVQADFVVVAVGVQPNAQPARNAGIAIDLGIVVDKRLQTSASDVYAAGDVAQTTDLVTGKHVVPASWTSAAEMGRVAGHNMTGGDHQYLGTLAVMNSFVLAGMPTVSVGMIQPTDSEDYHVSTVTEGNCYRKFVLRDDRLLGALLVGNIGAAGLCTWLIKRGDKISTSSLRGLMAGRADHAAWLMRASPTHAGRHIIKGSGQV